MPPLLCINTKESFTQLLQPKPYPSSIYTRALACKVGLLDGLHCEYLHE